MENPGVELNAVYTCREITRASRAEGTFRFCVCAPQRRRAQAGGSARPQQARLQPDVVLDGFGPDGPSPEERQIARRQDIRQVRPVRLLGLQQRAAPVRKKALRAPADTRRQSRSERPSVPCQAATRAMAAVSANHTRGRSRRAEKHR